MTKENYLTALERYQGQIVTCKECGKSMPMKDWPVMPSNGRPKRTCCLTTGGNNKKRYKNRQKMIDGVNHVICYSCKEYKTEDLFHRYNGILRSICSPCHNERYRGYESPSARKAKMQTKIKRMKREHELIECKACGKKTKRKDFPKESSGKLATRCCAERTIAHVNRRLRKRGLSYCSECNTVKEIEAFGFCHTRNKPQSKCKPCAKAIGLKQSYSQKRANAIAAADDRTLTGSVVGALFAGTKICPCCNKAMNWEDKTLDHWVPISKGGLHSQSNAIVLCRSCNSRKSDMSPSEWLDKIDKDARERVLAKVKSLGIVCEQTS